MKIVPWPWRMHRNGALLIECFHATQRLKSQAAATTRLGGQCRTSVTVVPPIIAADVDTDRKFFSFFIIILNNNTLFLIPQLISIYDG